jgi:hypothetical protein
MALLGVLALTTAGLVTAPGASAATEAGNRCLGDSSVENLTTISLANGPGSPLPATIPADGVITKWTFNIEPIPSGLITVTLKMFRPTGAAKEFKVIGESAPAPLVSGLNTFSSRIPVKAGDHIADHAIIGPETGAEYCQTTNAGDLVGAFAGNPSLNTTATITAEEKELSNPIVVFVEADADGDGFGDETQDACPQSAATQSPCPAVTFSTKTQVKKASVNVAVTTNTAAPVKVEGVVNLGKGKRATLKGGTKNLTAGVAGKFTLKLPKSVKSRLAGLSRKRSLTLKVTVSGTSLAGQVTTKVLKVKLKGQAKS